MKLLHFSMQYLMSFCLKILSYQRRKTEGKTKHPAVAELSKERQAELRNKWRRYQRSHRNKIRSLPLESWYVPSIVPKLNMALTIIFAKLNMAVTIIL